MTPPFESAWPLLQLSRGVIEMCDGPFGSSLTSAHYRSTGPRVIRLGNVGQARFRDADEARISDEHFATLRRHAVRAGDLLVAGLGDENNPLGRACVAPDGLGPAIVKADCFRFRLSPTVFDQRFVAWALSSTAGQFAVRRISRGSTRLRANLGGIASIRVPHPSIVTQIAVADFLDVETGRIDSAIELRTQQERLLAERLAAAENLELNPCDHDDWVPRRLSRLCDAARPIQYGIVLPGPNVPDGVLLVKGGDIKPGRLDPTMLSRTSREIESSFARSRLRDRDLVFAIRGGVGDVELVPGSLVGANITQDVARIAPLPEVDELWLLHALRSSRVQSQASAMITGATIRGINIGDLRRLVVMAPPSEVQRQIGAKIAARSAAYARLSATIHRQIALLRERRQALITAAVTGHLQVPETTSANPAS